jgi:hypothetical protein
MKKVLQKEIEGVLEQTQEESAQKKKDHQESWMDFAQE